MTTQRALGRMCDGACLHGTYSHTFSFSGNGQISLVYLPQSIAGIWFAGVSWSSFMERMKCSRLCACAPTSLMAGYFPRSSCRRSLGTDAKTQRKKYRYSLCSVRARISFYLSGTKVLSANSDGSRRKAPLSDVNTVKNL